MLFFRLFRNSILREILHKMSALDDAVAALTTAVADNHAATQAEIAQVADGVANVAKLTQELADAIANGQGPTQAQVDAVNAAAQSVAADAAAMKADDPAPKV